MPIQAKQKEIHFFSSEKKFLSSEFIKLLLIEMIDKIIRRYPEYQFMYNSLDFLVLCQKNVGHTNDIKKMCFFLNSMVLRVENKYF